MLLVRRGIPSMSALPLHRLRFLESGGLHLPPRGAKTGPGLTNRATSPLECTHTKNDLVGSLECPVTNSLDLKSPGIRASWPFGSAEVLLRPATSVTSLECALTRHRQGPVNPLESALTRLLGLKSFRFCTYKKRGGGGGPAAMPPQSVFTFTGCFTSRSSGVHR